MDACAACAGPAAAGEQQEAETAAARLEGAECSGGEDGAARSDAGAAPYIHRTGECLCGLRGYSNPAATNHTGGPAVLGHARSSLAPHHHKQRPPAPPSSRANPGLRAYLESSGLAPLLHEALSALVRATEADRLALAAGVGLDADGARPRGWRPFDSLEFLGQYLLQRAGPGPEAESGAGQGDLLGERAEGGQPSEAGAADASAREPAAAPAAAAAQGK
jgi:hypothetical protein